MFSPRAERPPIEAACLLSRNMVSIFYLEALGFLHKCERRVHLQQGDGGKCEQSCSRCLSLVPRLGFRFRARCPDLLVK